MQHTETSLACAVWNNYRRGTVATEDFGNILITGPNVSGTTSPVNRHRILTTFAGFILLAIFNSLLIMVFGTAPWVSRSSAYNTTTAVPSRSTAASQHGAVAEPALGSSAPATGYTPPAAAVGGHTLPAIGGTTVV